MSGSKSVRPVSSILVSAFLLGILATASLAQNAAPQTAPNNPPLTPLPQAPAPQPDSERPPEGGFSEDIPYGLRISEDCRRLEPEPREHQALMLMMELLVQDFSY